MKPSDLETLEATVSVQRLAESTGLKLTKRGAVLVASCSFHSSKKPTLTVDPKLNTWTCSGKCKIKNGTVLDWIQKSEGVSKKHAIELLKSDFGTNPVKPPKGKKSTAASFVSPEDADHVVMDRVVSYYTATLKESQEAQGYLRDRGLVHGELIDAFRLGYSNRTLGYRIQAKNRKHGFQLRGQLERLGIYRSTGHELMWGCLTIPILDEHGLVVDLYGRKILGDKRLRPGTPLHMWLPGSRKSIFNIQALKASQEVILTDSLMNAVSFWVNDLRNVTAVHGPEHFKEWLLPAFLSHGTKRVYLAFRRTQEGEQWAQEASDSLSEQGIETFRVVFPQGMDANDLARSVESPRDALSQAVRSAIWMQGKTPSVAQAEPVQVEPVQPFEASLDEVVQAEPEQHGDEVVLQLADRRWRIRGLRKNLSFEILKVNVLVGRDNSHPMGHGFHVDTLELYSARQRTAFIRQASDELGLDEQIVKHDLGKVLLELERLQDQLIRAELQPENKPVEMTEAEREQALQLLRDPKIVERIVQDLERCGLVGEPINKLVAYLATISRKLKEPLAVVIQSSSAAGKTSLMDSVLNFVPDEDRSSFSALTGQALYYLGQNQLAHKVLAVAEETGAHRASYALKLLQSEGEISIASTAKDPGTGRLVTQEYKVVGPVMLFMTTTSLDLDPELSNRCIVLTVDEGKEQTQAIHALQRQRQTLEGLLQGQDRDALVSLHKNAQRLLRPVQVVNPFALELTYFDGQTRSRRDHQKYLTLIRTVTLLHQYQRATKTVEHKGHKVEYIEVEKADLELANRLAKEVLNPAVEEIPPQTAKLLDMIKQCVQEMAKAQEVEPSKVRFTRRQLREHVGFSNSTLRLHLARLVDLEYLIQERGHRRVTFYGYDADLAGLEATWRGHGGPPPRQVESNDSRDLSSLGGISQPARLGKQRKSASYSHIRGR